MADKQISQLVAATTINNDDLFVMQQGGTAKKLSGQKLADFVYQSAADQIERVDEAVEQAQAAVDSLEEQKNEIAQTIASMAELGTDTTLSTPGMAADAAATGVVKDTALARFEQAEITGVSVASFDDGADNVPVKKLVVGIEPVQDLNGYDNPWPGGGGVNKLDPSQVTATNGAYGFTETWDSNVGSCTISGTYTGTAESVTFRLLNTPSAVRSLNVKGFGSPATNFGLLRWQDNADQIVIQMTNLVNGNSYNLTVYPIVYEGSTAPTAWSPYSNICPISGWTEANVLRAGKNLLPESEYITNNSGTTSKTINCYFRFLAGSSVKLTGYAADGTALTGSNCQVQFKNNNISIFNMSPNNPADSKTFESDTIITSLLYYTTAALADKTIKLQLEFGLTASSYEQYKGLTYPITFPTEAGTVYGGTLDVTNGKLTVDRVKSVITKNEIASISVDGANVRVSATAGLVNIFSAYQTGFCNKGIFVTSWRDCGNTKNAIAVNNPGANQFIVNSSFGTTLQEIKDAAGDDGFEICTKLATPVVYDLTPTEVKTLLALNNIWADTGNVLNLIYRKMPISAEEIENTLESMIAGVEVTMEATQNYTAGNLVIAAHKLYHISSNIASGETLVSGTNCYVTTVADELANLAITMDIGFSALGNLANLTYQVVT